MTKERTRWLAAGSIVIAAGLVLDAAAAAVDVRHESQFGDFVIEVSSSSTDVVQGAILGDVFTRVDPEEQRTGLDIPDKADRSS